MIYDLELKTPITAQFNGQSVINYLADRFTYKTREQWEQLINSGAISVNGEKVSNDYLLKEGTDKANKMANETLREVKEAMGIDYFYNDTFEKEQIDKFKNC